MKHLVTLEVEGDGRVAELVANFCMELIGREQAVHSCTVKRVDVDTIPGA